MADKAKVEGAATPLTDLFHVKKVTDDEAVIDIKVANPLHRIANILEQIKNHQSTTVSLRFTIPLIALPIVFLLAFTWGKAISTCSPLFETRTGMLKVVKIETPQKDSSFLSKLSEYFPVVPPASSKNLSLTEGVILLEQSGSVLTVRPQSMLVARIFDNQEVLVSGDYSACTNSIEVASSSNISAK